MPAYRTRKPQLRHWLLALLAPMLGTLVCWLLNDWGLVPEASLVLIYLMVVLLVGVSTATRPALLSAVLSFLAYNFWFTEPRLSLYMMHQQEVMTAFLMVLVALVTGQLTAGLREKVDTLESTMRWTRRQMSLAQSLSSCMNSEELLTVFARELRVLFEDGPVDVQLVDGRKDVLADCTVYDGRELIVIKHEHSMELRLPAPPDAYDRVVLTYDERSPNLIHAQLDAAVELLRLAWSRVLLIGNLQQETMIKEREQLRSALLSSISHDLRTPLATMIGSVSSLVELKESLSQQQQDELLDNTLSEARRLDRYIQKLLDMTRLGQGELKLERDWVGVDEIVSVSLRRLEPLLSGQILQTRIEPDLPLLKVHGALIEQAVFNVLENALRYTPAGEAILVDVRQQDGNLLMDITDSGPGIPEEHWAPIFDMFYTLAQGDHNTAGTGLGLTICQSILGAHGGSATVVSSSSEQGTCFRLTLPLAVNAPADEA
ncbi:ATP-binding protein [Oceanobacter mangrovi]|uniref:ATP-binding protein n=1 Tax=Oceanobacter mangrovi TaxID=2862510 RepID=UPI001C8EAA5C|nr:ATP-binding protein [Oceanobacter mangrovi]